MFAYYELTFAGIVSLLLAPPIALIAALLVRRRFPSSWPVAAVVLIPALTVGTFLAATRNMADHLWMWLYPDSWRAPAAIALLSILLFAVIRQRGFTRPEATWTAVTSFLIGLASIPERQLGVPGQPGEALLACVAGGLDRYLPMNFDDILDDLGPNLILYAPLGFILAVRGLSLRRTLATALALSGAVELYQAVFTTRVCAPRDLIANAGGALLGAATVHFLTRRDARPVARPTLPIADVGEASTMVPLDSPSNED